MKPGVNPGGPPPKAKYYLATDSAQVGRPKNEKNPGEGSEIEPETIHLQAVGARWRTSGDEAAEAAGSKARGISKGVRSEVRQA